MAYLRAILFAVLGGLALGAATGAVGVVRLAFASLPPGDQATVLAASISEAVNCAVFFVMVLVPLAVILVFTIRRRRPPAPKGAK